MRPRKGEASGSGDLFRSRLEQIINMKHELERLAQEIDWDWLDDQVADCFSAEGGFPHERSGLSHWRGRLGERLELLLTAL